MFFMKSEMNRSFITTVSSPFSFIIKSLLYTGVKVTLKNFTNLHRRREQCELFEHKSGDIEAHRERDQRVPNQSCRGIAIRGFPVSRSSLTRRVDLEWRSARDLETNPSVTVQDSRTRLIIPSTGTQTHSHTRKHCVDY